jgi:Protein of unknown function (DUF3592)
MSVGVGKGPSAELASIPPPPRRVRRRRGYLPIVMRCVFVVLLLMFTSVVSRVAFGTVRLLWFSQLLPATVTTAEVAADGRGRTWDITLAYQYGGADYAETVRTGRREGEELKAGDAVQVQVLPERPDRPQLYDPRYPARFVTVLMCVIGLMPVAMTARALWDLTVVPWQLRRLLRDGTVTTGVIAGKETVRGRQPTYNVTYQYPAPPPPAAGVATAVRETMCATMTVPQEDYQAAEVGDAVAVIYCPERPRASVVPRFADYEFVHP